MTEISINYDIMKILHSFKDLSFNAVTPRRLSHPAVLDSVRHRISPETQPRCSAEPLRSYKPQGIPSCYILVHSEITGHGLMQVTTRTTQSTASPAAESSWAGTVLTGWTPSLPIQGDTQKGGLATTGRTVILNRFRSNSCLIWKHQFEPQPAIVYMSLPTDIPEEPTQSCFFTSQLSKYTVWCSPVSIHPLNNSSRKSRSHTSLCISAARAGRRWSVKTKHLFQSSLKICLAPREAPSPSYPARTITRRSSNLLKPACIWKAYKDQKLSMFSFPNTHTKILKGGNSGVPQQLGKLAPTSLLRCF